MRRTQIYLEESVDDAIAAEAVRRGVSKSELIRQAVAREVPKTKRAVSGWDALIGLASGDGEPFDIDDVVYGPKSGPLR